MNKIKTVIAAGGLGTRLQGFRGNDSTKISATYSNDASSIVWSSYISFSDTLGMLDSLSVFSSGVFYVKVINGVCEQVDSIVVLSESINIDIISNDICIGDSVLIKAQNLNSSLPITVYNWSGFTQNSSLIFVAPDSSRWYSVEVENTNDDLLPFLLTIPLQKLAYYSALKKGYDIDKPRNLAKSVTVE